MNDLTAAIREFNLAIANIESTDSIVIEKWDAVQHAFVGQWREGLHYVSSKDGPSEKAKLNHHCNYTTVHRVKAP